MFIWDVTGGAVRSECSLYLVVNLITARHWLGLVLAVVTMVCYCQSLTGLCNAIYWATWAGSGEHCTGEHCLCLLCTIPGLTPWHRDITLTLHCQSRPSPRHQGHHPAWFLETYYSLHYSILNNEAKESLIFIIFDFFKRIFLLNADVFQF